MEPLFWILRHNDDNRVLCNDGKRRMMAFCVSELKRYKRLHNASRRAGTEYTCYAVHEGDSLDVCGKITTGHGWVK